MKFDVAIGDRIRQVTVVRKDGVLHVELDGRAHVVDARRIGDAALSLLVERAGNGPADVPVCSIDAAFAAKNGGELDVHLAGRTIPVQVRPAARSTSRRSSSSLRTGPAGPARVLSPMPGKIVKVLVKVGDAVTARQGLVVVEAMKMENELGAPRDGRVRELPVAEGQPVDAGALLVVVE